MKKNKKEVVFPSGAKSGWIIGVVSVIGLALMCFRYWESEVVSYILLNGIVDFCLLAFLLMIVAIPVGILCERFTPNGIKILCAINSLTACGVSVVLYLCSVTGSFLVWAVLSVLFYFINTHCLLQLKKRALSKKKAFAIVAIVFAAWVAVLVACVVLYQLIIPTITPAVW